MLDDCLSPEVKARVQCAFREKVFRPVYRCLEETKPFWWFTVTNNWNSVCLAGVTGAALTLLADKEERAYFVAAAEKYNVYGMKGYADDGYCSEGSVTIIMVSVHISCCVRKYAVPRKAR